MTKKLHKSTTFIIMILTITAFGGLSIYMVSRLSQPPTIRGVVIKTQRYDTKIKDGYSSITIEDKSNQQHVVHTFKYDKEYYSRQNVSYEYFNNNNDCVKVPDLKVGDRVWFRLPSNMQSITVGLGSPIRYSGCYDKRANSSGPYFIHTSFW
jgi:hypothetical protein